MAKPYKCPKCNGVGMLGYDPNNPFREIGTVSGPWHCIPCGGTGIIWSTDPVIPIAVPIVVEPPPAE